MTIRPIEFEDIEDGGFLEVLENLVPTGIDIEHAKRILEEIKSNRLHRIFVAQIEQENNKKAIVGTTTLLVEPKFINKGMRVGYIEDVSVRIGYAGLGIGSKLIIYATNYAISEGCKRILLYCSGSTRPFYEKLGYKLADDTFVMKFET